ncbi:SixA phosphatase family protein [Sphingomonas glacialis]|uniref:Histidine phosphatase family protein n=1 Tax=Sphingomonas glacialis TaxID=658225 RepID=A0A502FSW6_9SPHN|nr:histidine phosphatase family protein [Sphingomonas glacialis]TPG52687.1 histidine phosphatase family protein [Sphingomonas glacialis]
MTAGTKTLTLLRHAKSGWDDPALRDYDRGLNAKGKRAAALIGGQLRKTPDAFDHVVASPAVRVVETLEQVEVGYGRTLAPRFDRRIYLASAVTLLDIVHETPAEATHILLVGHNPGLEDLAMLLVPASDEPLRVALEAKYPTATIAELSFEGAWGDLAAGSARLTRFVRPRDLDPALGPDED